MDLKNILKNKGIDDLLVETGLNIIGKSNWVIEE